MITIDAQTQLEAKYTADKRIEAIKEQIKEYQYRVECSNIQSDKWWYNSWIEWMKKRIAMYQTI